MNDSNDEFSELFEDDSGKQRSTFKLVELRKKCQEIDSLILELCEKLEYSQVSLQKLKNQRSNILNEINRLKDEMIPDLNA
ncbi:MAG: hypothetical protein P8J18_03300 [Halieaceae bacterium]|nr:hypothetical protein [Halieaceae bacterium]